jgi:putative ABC transport system permease protein
MVHLLLLILLLPPGQAVPAGAGAPGILVERRLAEDLRLGMGDTLRVRAQASGEEARPFAVEGIFERAADPNRISRNEYEVRLHLPDLEALLPTHDRVDRFAIVLRAGASPDSVARWIEGLAFGTRAFPAAALAEETSATFRVISRFHRAIGVVTILASAIFLLCVMIIRVDERRRDVAVLRLIGVSRATVFRAVVLEAIGIALLGSLLGALLGGLLTRFVNLHYGALYDTTLRFALLTPGILGTAVVLGLLLGVGAGALAALRLVRTPVERLGER